MPIDKKLNSGKLTMELYNDILNIQYGKVDHEWSVIVWKWRKIILLLY